MNRIDFPGGYVIYDRHWSGFCASIKQDLNTWEIIEYRALILEGGL